MESKLFLLLLLLLLIAVAFVSTNGDRCLLPKDIGGCSRRFRGYYYDAKSGYCIRLVFGTCGGNENKFRTKDQCEQACGSHRCQLPEDFGPCRPVQSVYRYNPEAGACQKFDYGGHGGNANRFTKLDDCERQCVFSDSPVTTALASEATTKPQTNNPMAVITTIPPIKAPNTTPPEPKCRRWPCNRPWLARSTSPPTTSPIAPSTTTTPIPPDTAPYVQPTLEPIRVHNTTQSKPGCRSGICKQPWLPKSTSSPPATPRTTPPTTMMTYPTAKSWRMHEKLRDIWKYNDEFYGTAEKLTLN